MYASTITLPGNIVTGLYTLTVLGAVAGCEQTISIPITGIGTPTPNPTPAPTGGIFTPFTSTAPADGVIVLQNGQIETHINLHIGGAIDFISLNGGENVINTYITGNALRPQDVGRQKGTGLFRNPGGGDNPANAYCDQGQCTTRTEGDGRVTGGIGDNPNMGGDENRNGSPVLASGVQNVAGYGQMAYTKTRGLQWGMNNVPGYYYVEAWTWLDGQTVRTHYKITGIRPAEVYIQKEARTNELSYCYVTAKHTQYYAVLKGSEPERIDQWLTYNRNNGAPQPGWQKDHMVATGEPWLAAINPATGQGVGYINTTGFHQMQIKSFGEQGHAGPHDNESGYMAATPQVVLDHDVVFEYEDAVCLGTLAEIKAKARSLTQRDYRPHFVFNSANGRLFAFHMKAVANSWRLSEGKYILTPDDKRVRIELPTQTFNGADVPKLYIRMEYTGPETQLRVRWRQPDQTETEAGQVFQSDPQNDQRKEFSVESGVEKTYEIDLSNNPNWNSKRISRIWIERKTQPTSEDPAELALSGETWKVVGISWKPFNLW